MDWTGLRLGLVTIGSGWQVPGPNLSAYISQRTTIYHKSGRNLHGFVIKSIYKSGNFLSSAEG